MLKRFSISLEEELLADFDHNILGRQYSNRSEAIRDLIRKALVQKQWAEDREVMGLISLVYDHHQHHLQDKLTEAQHVFHHQIVSSTHVHMDHDNCMEVIIVRGKAGEILELTESLTALKGVKDGNLTMSSTGNSLH